MNIYQTQLITYYPQYIITSFSIQVVCFIYCSLSFHSRMSIPVILVAISACKGTIGGILNNFVGDVKISNGTISASEHDTFIRKKSDVGELNDFHISGIDDVII